MSAFKGGGSGFTKGMVQKFRADQVPDGWGVTAQAGLLPTNAIPAQSAAYTYGVGTGDVAYVSAGTGQGLWRYRAGWLQRFDIATNKEVGEAYLVPLTGGASQETLMTVYAGTKLYIMGVQGSTGTVGNRCFSFDTETNAFTQLASFPGTVGSTLLTVDLSDGRVLFRCRFYAGVADTQAATNFFICDPVTNAAPVRVLVSMPFAGIPATLTRLPSGAVLVVGSTVETNGQTASCLLTVSGNTITPGPTIPTGYTTSTDVSRALLPTATGAYHGTVSTGATAGRTFSEGSGWSALGPGPVAYTGSGVGHAVTSRFHPGIGWLCSGSIAVGGSGIAVTWVFTNSPYASVGLVEAVKL